MRPRDSDSWQEDDRRNREHYASRVDRYGTHYRSLDWSSRETQLKRFAVLNRIGTLDGATVLDVGCGLGDFYDWLLDQGVKPDYTGIDLTPEMVKVARERFPSARFAVRNPLRDEIEELGSFEFVVASGVFSYRSHRPFEYLKALVERMFHLAGRGLGFNALSRWGVSGHTDMFYADPARTLEFAREVTPWVDLHHDYLPRDFTVFMYHTRQQA